MRIVIETVDHKDQQYDAVGNWFSVAEPFNQCLQREETLTIRVSRMCDWRSEALVAVHELVEALLCRQVGITAEQVDAWDMGPGKDHAEPGDCPAAPYHHQHQAAETVERLMAMWLRLAWPLHENNCINAMEREREGCDIERYRQAQIQSLPDMVLKTVFMARGVDISCSNPELAADQILTAATADIRALGPDYADVHLMRVPRSAATGVLVGGQRESEGRRRADSLNSEPGGIRLSNAETPEADR